VTPYSLQHNKDGSLKLHLLCIIWNTFIAILQVSLAQKFIYCWQNFVR